MTVITIWRVFVGGRRVVRTGLTMLFGVGLFACAPLFVHPAWACSAPAPILTLTPVSRPEILDNTHSQRDMQSLSGLGNAVHSYRVPLALGLTLTQVTTTTRLTVAINGGGWGREKCAILQNLDIGFGFTPHTIYIPREFAPMTCAYNAIYSHEIKHVETDRRLEALVAQMKAAGLDCCKEVESADGFDADNLSRMVD